MPVVFITGYPERFLTGTPPEPAFLVSKPYGADSLKAVIRQALFFDNKARPRADHKAISAISSNVVRGPWKSKQSRSVEV
jgi:hypothetical protein